MPADSRRVHDPVSGLNRGPARRRTDVRLRRSGRCPSEGFAVEIPESRDEDLHPGRSLVRGVDRNRAGLVPLSAAAVPAGIAAGAVPAVVAALKADSSNEPEAQRSDDDASGKGKAGDDKVVGELTEVVSEDLQKLLPSSVSQKDFEKLEQLREIMNPSQRREFFVASTLEDGSADSEYFGELIDEALQADRWADFLRYLTQFDARIEEEAAEMGFALEDSEDQHFATYLTKVGCEPQEFVASLFRTSDLVRLFPYFDPVEWEPQEFLDRQFQCWSHQESVMINEDGTEADEKVTGDEVAPSTREISFRTGAGRPVRRLFQALKELNGAEALEINLNSVEDYVQLKGPMEPRFCEWVYRRIESRKLVDGLAGEILRPSDVTGLRKLWDLPVDETGGGWPQTLHDVLAEIGVHEPGLPPHLDSGFPKVRQAAK